MQPIDHVLKEHKKIITEIDVAAPVEVSKENKKDIDKAKNQRVILEDARKLALENERIRQEHLQQNADRIKKIEEEKLRMEEEKLQVEKDFINEKSERKSE
jgi:hypothetical protein